MSEKKESLEIIGVIGKPHGIKGYVYVRIFADYPDSIIEESILFLDEKEKRQIKVEKILDFNVKGGKRTVFKFYGIKNRDDAESLRGKNLFKKFKGKTELKDGFYLKDDLMGCSVYTSDGFFIGNVIDIENFPSIDSLLINKEESSGKNEVLQAIQKLNKINAKKDKDRLAAKNIISVPMTDDYIENIDIKAGKIILLKIPEYI